MILAYQARRVPARRLAPEGLVIFSRCRNCISYEKICRFGSKPDGPTVVLANTVHFACVGNKFLHSYTRILDDGRYRIVATYVHISPDASKRGEDPERIYAERARGVYSSPIGIYRRGAVCVRPLLRGNSKFTIKTAASHFYRNSRLHVPYLPSSNVFYLYPTTPLSLRRVQPIRKKQKKKRISELNSLRVRSFCVRTISFPSPASAVGSLKFSSLTIG